MFMFSAELVLRNKNGGPGGVEQQLRVRRWSCGRDATAEGERARYKPAGGVVCFLLQTGVRRTETAGREQRNVLAVSSIVATCVRTCATYMVTCHMHVNLHDRLCPRDRGAGIWERYICLSGLTLYVRSQGAFPGERHPDYVRDYCPRPLEIMDACNYLT